MTVQVTMTFATAAEAASALARMTGGTKDAPNPQAKPAATEAAAASSPPAASAAASETKAPASTKPPAASPKPEPDKPKAPPPPPLPAEPEVKYATSGLPELIKEAQVAGRIADVKAYLAEVGVEKGPQLDTKGADAIAKVKAKVEALVAEIKAAESVA
jgi:hypothetical protein